MLDRIVFSVASSDGQRTYDCEAILRRDGVRFTCTCDAGSWGQHCKHRIGLLTGVVEGDATTREQARILRSWYDGSEEMALLAAIQAHEKEIKRQQRDMQKKKERLATLFNR